MKKLTVINGLRGLAILGVIFHHSFFDNFRYGVHGSAGVLHFLASAFLSSGWLGVNLFFLLSGLVLYWPYACRTRALVQKADVLQFYKRRFLRLVPLYWFVCLISLVFVIQPPLSSTEFLESFKAFATLTFPLTENFMPRANFVLWSLGVEFQFSLIFPFLVLLTHKIGWRRMFFIALIVSIAVCIYGQSIDYRAPRGEMLNQISDSVLGRLVEFFLGMWLAHLIANRTIQTVFSGSRALLGTIAIGCAMYAWGMWFRMQIPPWSPAIINLSLDLGMFYVVGYLTTGQPGTGMRRLFELWPLQMMGLMCYSLYLWHGIIGIRMPEYNKGILEYVIYLVVVLLLSGATYRYFEFGSEQNLRNLLPPKHLSEQRQFAA